MRKYWHKKKRQATFEWIVIITDKKKIIILYVSGLLKTTTVHS